MNLKETLYGHIDDPLSKGYLEVIRLIYALRIDRNYSSLLVHTFRKVRDALHQGTKYRDPLRLAPLVIFFALWFRKTKIDISYLLEYSLISKSDFMAFHSQIIKYWETHRADYKNTKKSEKFS